MSTIMDLTRLTRPAILCQCSRCSSSLAALENEWAKLSNSYSIAAGWLSVELHRISISHEKKQIPQSSELSVLRGRILQEISCKLCQQKLGVLCALDNGPNVFWKLSKVSFREIVTMRTVEPTFKEGSLERLLYSTPASQNRTPVQPGALVPTGSTAIENYNGSVEQHIQHQGLSLDHISSSVSNLHDTMFELKNAFTALRIELNGPGRFGSDMGTPASKDMMIATVLKELRSKSDEIERMKLEMEAMKLRNRYAEEQSAKPLPPPMLSADVGMLPEVRSPGLLQGSRKRPWPDSFPSGRTQPIGDSFDETDDDDSIADFTLEDVNIPPVKIPIKDPQSMHTTTDTTHEPTPSGTPQLRIERGQSERQTPHLENGLGQNHETASNSPHEAILKRPRLAQPSDKPSTGKKAGRPPRKSLNNQTSKPDNILSPKPTPLTEQNGNLSSTATNNKDAQPTEPSPSDSRVSKETRPNRSRSLRSRSRPPSRRISAANAASHHPEPEQTPTTNNNNNNNNNINTNTNNEHANKEGPEQTESHLLSAGKENSHVTTNGVHKPETREKRKAQTAARDIMVRLAMQREEAMETEDSR
ncbi:hypothetical protein BO70DRAFT_330939 [Aspergillus heteromorphus CBS 117.55]|uniref:Mis18 domain-containing protein n=1 Tax=Aspergillus heteromorphus CBS 117.55 TaxID=1448321 RepID=A0A317WTI4_9EURO|nr:uncharacterized protein BO70DRAFT_330939 [Aspergillus heteromorphus CBS 117.55]PWY89111.1 hypothetical protein BO70DRAFT_330939 [Aspergillus heteromorphus CBS 117.55]